MAGGGGVEIEIDSDEKIAGANDGGAGAGHLLVEGTGAEVGRFARKVGTLGQPFVFALAAYGEIFALGGEGRGLVAVGGHAELSGDALGEGAGHGGALLEGDAADGDEREHVCGSDARVCAGVAAHVDELSCASHAAESGLHHGLGLADEGDDGAVGGLSGVYVEHFHAFHLFDCIYYTVDD